MFRGCSCYSGLVIDCSEAEKMVVKIIAKRETRQTSVTNVAVKATTIAQLVLSLGIVGSLTSINRLSMAGSLTSMNRLSTTFELGNYNNPSNFQEAYPEHERVAYWPPTMQPWK